MENYNYEDLLKEKFAGDPKSVLAKYNYPDGTEIMDRLKNIGRDNEALKSILYEIVLWKLNRMVVMTDDDVLDKLRQIQDIKSPQDAIEKNETTVKEALQKLLGTKGVRLPMASTFLHFFNPKVFPIIDQRAYRVIFKKEYKEPFDLIKKRKYILII